MVAKGLKVLKFGGTSVGSAEAIRQVIAIVRKPQKDARIAAVVVSAMSGTTDQLIKIAHLAAAKDTAYKTELGKLEARHVEAVKKLIRKKNQKKALAEIEDLFVYLREAVAGTSLVRELPLGALDYIMSYGERLSAHILTEALNDRGVKADYLNARKVITTDDNFAEAAVDFQKTNRAIRKFFSSGGGSASGGKKHRKLQIVTGFIAATPDKKTTTLGRGGSDYTASILGAALGAKSIEIWTDVSGVMTADPRKVKDALPISSMTYAEAMEMSYFGAKVIHPPTMRPAQEKNIPLLIKNTFEPAACGTTISKQHMPDGRFAKGISSIGDVAMLQVEGSGLSRLKGAAGRLFGALARAGINVILITQASSQHAISFAIAPRYIEKACAAIEDEFASERAAKLIDAVTVMRDLSILAVVGEGMRHRHGVASRLFGKLGKNGVNIVAIAQGSSELNISVVVAKADEAKALNAVHTGFFFPETKPVNIFLLGNGLIGSTLLAQIARQREHLRREQGFVINIAGVANSKHMAFGEAGIDPAHVNAALAASKTPMDIEKFIARMKAAAAPGKVFVDCTASEEVARAYAGVLTAGISVVTPNKRANSGPYTYYKQLQTLAREPGVSFFYETNVCAALPVISVLDDFTLSGDRVLEIEGILSGTMSYIFNTFTGVRSFSEAVAEARAAGYTEPDPRQDLSGTDVARKILILARKAGFALELADVKVENLLGPKATRAKTVGAFFEELRKDDAMWDRKRKAAEKKGQHLRYIATLKKGKVKVGVRGIALPHPFYEMSGSDNIVTITTERYAKSPFLIQGPGAGGAVTAAGVFADILRVARDAA